ncbi:transcriptional regulator YeiL [Alkalicoccobacillus murimartini]|uniref:CRP-like cAMP-binding protein n=1 Tax=Alkalicoccobacillus murimartini TaxID=171685 RepID=A0ABT9YHP3_9BACI|nr:transcriptional regulator YeiL [Alkalicoccobacillus murimartini]MDQ0207385.1 CRP-like cAMP-binding protein [Alkalicoccobacillus murimartini]
MDIYTGDKKEQFLKMHSISDHFSFQVERYMEIHEYQRNEWIIREGTKPDYLFYVVEGKAKIYMTHQNGKVSLINFIKPCDYIGEMELIHESYYSKGIQVVAKTICFAIPFRECRTKLLEDVIFLRELTSFLSIKATFMATKSSQSQAYPLENRLAHFILELSDQGIYQEKHVTVCDYLGVSYRHLLYVLNQFCEKGYVEKEKRYYRTRNEEALRHLAGVLK